MGPFSGAVLVAALTVLRVLFFVTGGLLLLLVAVQAIRQDDGAQPLVNGAAAFGLVAAGAIAGKVAAILSAPRD